MYELTLLLSDAYIRKGGGVEGWRVIFFKFSKKNILFTIAKIFLYIPIIFFLKIFSTIHPPPNIIRIIA